MCGIAGIISSHPVEFATIKNMTDVIRHRGPDAEGYLISDKGVEGIGINANRVKCEVSLAFGHRRLAIIDLKASSNQPFCYLNRYWIVYNGEIYNYKDLRKQLIDRGYEFRTESDTEIIPAAYAEWGSGCVEKFNGMWSFVIYDELLNRIFISRDRFGIKPLYYYNRPGLFVFASEIKALLQHNQIKSEENIQYCLDYYQNGAMEYKKETAFNNIFRFPFASYFEGSIKDLTRMENNLHRYWTLQDTHSTGNNGHKEYDKNRTDYARLIEDAVRLRLQADVDVAVTLSGGIDSSTIAHFCRQSNENGHNKIESFSSVYTSTEEKACDESDFINIISSHLGIKNNKITPDVKKFVDEHKKMIHAMDCPPDSICMAGWFTYKLLGQSGIKVNLEGQGADELLAGYRRYKTRYYASVSMIRTILSMIKNEPANLFSLNIISGYMINILAKILSPRLLKRILSRTGYTADLTVSCETMMRQDFTHELVNLLKYADTESMYNSIETRFPYMDYRLVELLVSVPIEHKITNGWSKYLARDAFRHILPASINWRRDKMGWPVPDSYWLRQIHFNYISDVISSSKFVRELVGSSEIKRVLRKRNETKKLVRLLNLAVWHQIYFENKTIQSA